MYCALLLFDYLTPHNSKSSKKLKIILIGETICRLSEL